MGTNLVCFDALLAAPGLVQIARFAPQGAHAEMVRMATLLEYVTPDGDTVRFAVLAPGDDVQAVSRVGDAVKKMDASLGDVLSMIGGVARSFHQALAGAPVEGATVEVGMQFTAKGTVYLVGAEVESAIKVTLTLGRPAGAGAVDAGDASSR